MYADVLISYMCHKICMLVFVIVCVFCEWKLMSIENAFFVFECVLLIFALSVMVFKCGVFVCCC